MVNEPVSVFINYAAEDVSLLTELERHLAPLGKLMEVWHRGRVPLGSDLMREAAVHLAQARVVVHLVSSDYLANKTCCDQAEHAIKCEGDGVTNVAVIARACLWRSATSVPAVVLPTGGKPVTSWPSRDEAWTAVAEGIKSAVALAAAAREIFNTIRANLTASGDSVLEAASDFAAGITGPSRSQNVYQVSNAEHGGERSTRTGSSLPEIRDGVEELIQILEDRAATIRSELQKYYSHVDVQEYLAEFEVLHLAHTTSLREGMLIRAHELARRIHRLSWRLESESFWSKHQAKTPTLRYRLTDDAFAHGPIAQTYFPELKIRQLPHSSLTQPTADESYFEAISNIRKHE
ncbi:toll/interleukin-1 receptor domain-containing protein [Polyangium aurulentum]|uniref:toll/interleukin-1 receptor domain-containing protein n=1 Tax=Polyangium aurulentum TaxID=2567896 RepID=UPI00200F416F|nr:toll/interleukin-1 receptor domain-containing protein [Polyangium aurulentum]UQA61782.1 toll/interleukin-1 receptor domain-containing protein [Polyangium aurulentum]